MKLRPYQQEVARAVMASVAAHSGLTLSVEIARQGGKNELSAHLEVLLLTLTWPIGGTLVKCSPTFKPQTIISMQRLKERLDDFGFPRHYRTEMGYIIVLGAAKAVFLSAEEASNVVGHTADISWRSTSPRTSARRSTPRSSGPWAHPPTSPPSTTAPPGTTPRCWKR
jgi:hypothetical protein